MTDDTVRPVEELGNNGGTETVQNEFRFFEGDVGDRTLDARRALNALIARPAVLNRKSPNLFKAIVGNRETVERDLSNMFMRLRLDTRRGVAWAEHIADLPDDVPVVKRRRRLHRNSQVLLVMLRLEANSCEISGEEACFIEKSRIEDYFRMHLYQNELDDTKMLKAVDAAIDEAVENKCLELVNKDAGIYRVSEVLSSWLDLKTASEWVAELEAAIENAQTKADACKEEDSDV